MINHHSEDRKKSISHRISDLIFLLNNLEKENPHIIEPNGTEHFFEYRLAQYQQKREIENGKS